MLRLSIIIPARNEQLGLAPLLPGLRALYSDAELIVVDDGSEDDTAAVARSAGATVVSHPYPKGNGAAIKTGARAATGDVLVFMDGDGQHDPADIAKLLPWRQSRKLLARRRPHETGRARECPLQSKAPHQGRVKWKAA